MLPLPPPRDFGWRLKPLESARTSVVRLADGRLELRINHSPIRGVTAAMLAWWFQVLDGEATYRGRTLPAYLLWHPLDHVALRTFRARPERVAPGDRIHIQEMFARDPRFAVDNVVTIHRWDEGGIGFHVDRMGLRVFELDHVFEDAPAGTDYRSCLRIGSGVGLLKPLVNRIAGRRFSDEMARVWLRHNVEEVGCFEEFLPELFAERAIRSARAA